jgi:hypothetical protein
MRFKADPLATRGLPFLFLLSNPMTQWPSDLVDSYPMIQLSTWTLFTIHWAYYEAAKHTKLAICTRKAQPLTTVIESRDSGKYQPRT